MRFWEENGQARTLWSAALYQEADTIREAADAALELYEIVTGEKDFDRSLWNAASHKSLCAGFNEADPDAIIAWNKRMADLVTMDGIAKAIRDQVPAGSIRKLQSLTKIQKEWLEKRLRKADFGEKMRLHYYLGVILEDENEVQECFRIIQSEVLEATIKSLAYNEQARIVTDHHTVRLPLRVNWGGGWSDTPPYCNEKGGTVLNAAILLNGEKPVEVTLERIPEQKVVFDSRDMDVHGEFDTIEPLQATGDPYDPFALQKACLLPVSLKCGDTGVIYRLSFLSIRQRLSRWRLIRSRNTIVERTEEIPSATGSAKKAAFAPKKEGRTAALITKRDFLVTESASPVFGHSRAVSPSTKTYWKLSGMIISV